MAESEWETAASLQEQHKGQTGSSQTDFARDCYGAVAMANKMDFGSVARLRRSKSMAGPLQCCLAGDVAFRSCSSLLQQPIERMW